MSFFSDAVSTVSHTASKAASAVGHGVSSGAKVASKAVQTGTKAAVKGGVSVLKSKLAEQAKQAFKNTPAGKTPVGMIATAAFSGLQAAAKGKNVEGIMWASAEGGAPKGWDRAVSAAHQLRDGQPVLDVALKQARAQLEQSSPAGQGFLEAERVLRAGGTSAMLKAARDRVIARMVSPETKAAATAGFHAAVGVVSQASQRAGLRAMSTPRVMSLGKPVARQVAHGSSTTTALVAKALAKNPALLARGSEHSARALRVPLRAINDAMRRITPRGLQWRAMSPRAANYVRAVVPHANIAALTGDRMSDTGALVGTGPQYKVEAGVYPYQVAQKYSPDHKLTRWHEIVPANPGTLKEVNLGGGNWTISPWTPGMVINLPASWFPNLPAPTPSLPTGPIPIPTSTSIPTPVPATGQTQLDAAAVAQAKASLAAWSKTDGSKSSPFPDYGVNLADFTPAWTERDGVMLVAFSRWWNGSGKSPALTEGAAPAGSAVVVQQLDQPHADALRSWAEGKSATAPAPTGPTSPIPGATPPSSPETPSFPTLPGLPSGVIPASFPTLPTAPTPVTPPAEPTTPAVPGVPGVPAGGTTSSESEGGAGLAIVGLLAAAALLA